MAMAPMRTPGMAVSTISPASTHETLYTCRPIKTGCRIVFGVHKHRDTLVKNLKG